VTKVCRVRNFNKKLKNFFFGGGGGGEARDIKNVLSKGYGMGSESSLESVLVNGARIA